MYLIARRFEGGPKGLLKVEKINSRTFLIIDVLINNDDKIKYRKSKVAEYYEYCIAFDERNPWYDDYLLELSINEHDEFIEFEDDDSAKLYFEVGEHE